jgi:hypothetical protein
VGDASVLLEDLETDFIQDTWWVMCGPPLTQKGISKKLGKQMAEQGYTPNMPIVLVPGTLPPTAGGRPSVAPVQSLTMDAVVCVCVWA